jgi:hypothetical protein
MAFASLRRKYTGGVRSLHHPERRLEAFLWAKELDAASPDLPARSKCPYNIETWF